jgi:hypothetical protein
MSRDIGLSSESLRRTRVAVDRQRTTIEREGFTSSSGTNKTRRASASAYSRTFRVKCRSVIPELQYEEREPRRSGHVATALNAADSVARAA